MLLPIALVLGGVVLYGYSMGVGFLPSQDVARPLGTILMMVGFVVGVVRTGRWVVRRLR